MTHSAPRPHQTAQTSNGATTKNTPSVTYSFSIKRVDRATATVYQAIMNMVTTPLPINLPAHVTTFT